MFFTSVSHVLYRVICSFTTHAGIPKLTEKVAFSVVGKVYKVFVYSVPL